MKISFIGLGVMGRGMALNMRRSEAQLTVFDSDRPKMLEFEQLGVRTASDLADAAQADIIFLSLPHTKAVESVLIGENGMAKHLKAKTIVVDLSTINYTNTVRLYQDFKKNDIYFLDAPVSGMQLRAEEGTLTVMCGGDEDAFAKVKPYLECIGNKVLYFGKSGCGQLTKLINQVLFDINAAALAEILPMSRLMGLDSEKIGAVINSGTGRSYASEFFIPRILEGNFSEGYMMHAAYKDLVSAAEMGAEQCIPMPVLAAATSTYQMALRKGYGNCDKGGMIQVFEDLLGETFRKEE
jgi:3-hydroxyisobutyrate dehydrogenase-like beta-hydroxyacid dehydrogenase